MNYQSLYKPPKSKFRRPNYHTQTNFSAKEKNNSYKKYLFALSIFLITIAIIKNIPENNTNKSTKKPTVLGSSTTANKNPINYNFKLPIPDYKTLSLPIKKDDASNLNIPAKSAILFDVENSYPLYEKNDRAQVPIASITKIMTAVVALEQYQIDQVVTIPKSAATVTGSRMKLATGEQMTVRDLLYGTMLVSGNDSAFALALLDPKSKNKDIKPFVEKMNQKAKLLGLNNTIFFCPAGLDDRGHSTAYDLAVLTAYALRNKTFTEIVSTAQKTVYSADTKKMKYDLINANRLVVPTESLYLASALGVKTGYTEEAGHSLVGAAKENNHTLVSVVLNTNNPAKPESARLNRELLTWGFATFNWPN